MKTVTHKQLKESSVAELAAKEGEQLYINLVYSADKGYHKSHFVFLEEIENTEDYMFARVSDLRGFVHRVKIGECITRSRGVETWTLIPGEHKIKQTDPNIVTADASINTHPASIAGTPLSSELEPVGVKNFFGFLIKIFFMSIITIGFYPAFYYWRRERLMMNFMRESTKQTTNP